jgi:serine/threonine protein kinase
LYHLAPEQINGVVYSGEKVDIWNAGIILFCFLTGTLPFCCTQDTVQKMFDAIKNARYEYPPNCNISDDAKKLISKLLQTDPEQRPTLDEIKKDKWTMGEQRTPTLMSQDVCCEQFH